MIRKRPTTKYGILDDLNEVVRWVWDQPGKEYAFVIKKIKRPKKEKIDFNKFEEALF